jgi:transcriptional regulator
LIGFETGSRENGSLFDADAIQRKVAQLRKKGSSRQHIIKTLSAGPQDLTIITQTLELHDAASEAEEDGDTVALKQLMAKLKRQGIDE